MQTYLQGKKIINASHNRGKFWMIHVKINFKCGSWGREGEKQHKEQNKRENFNE